MSIRDLQRTFGKKLSPPKISENETKDSTHLQSNLNESAADENTMKSKMQFINNTLHEIRVPFSSIYMGLDLLKEEEAVKLSPEGKEILDAAISACRSMKDIMDDTLDFAKIESGSFTIRPAQFSVCNLITETVKRMVPFAKDLIDSVKLELNCDRRALDLYAHGDKGRLQQVLANCISNAIKFSAKNGHGKVAVTASILHDGQEINIENVWWKDDSSEDGSYNPVVLNETIVHDKNLLAVSLFAENEKIAVEYTEGKPRYQHCTILLSVKDNGPGINLKDFPRLFKSFQQLDAGARSKHSGTGLGLAICKEIVRLHRGRVGVRSSGIPGDGTEFIIALRLPLIHQVTALRESFVYGLSERDNHEMTNLIKSRNFEDDQDDEEEKLQGDDADYYAGLVSPRVISIGGAHNWDQPSESKQNAVVQAFDPCHSGAVKTFNDRVQQISLCNENNEIPGQQNLKGVSKSTVHEIVGERVGESLSEISSGNVGENCPQSHQVFRILVVDDVDSNRKLLRRCLECRFKSERHRLCGSLTTDRKQIVIEEASDGHLALQKVLGVELDPLELSTYEPSKIMQFSHVDLDLLSNYDLITLDAQMPTMNGENVAQILRDNGYRGLIYGCTGNSQEYEIANFISKGADFVFVKPVDVDALLQRLFDSVVHKDISEV